MRILYGRDTTATTMAFAPDGVLLAAAGLMGGVHVWDTHSGELVTHFDFPTNGFSASKMLFTTPHELCVFMQSIVNVCDLRTKRHTRCKQADFHGTDAWQVMVIEAQRLQHAKEFIYKHSAAWYTKIGPVLRYVLDPAERWIVLATKPAIFMCDRTQPATPPRKIVNPSEHDFTMCALHPEGTQLATLAGEKQVRLWDTRTLELQATFVWDVGTLHAVAYAPDGLRAAVGTGSGKVLVLDVE